MFLDTFHFSLKLSSLWDTVFVSLFLALNYNCSFVSMVEFCLCVFVCMFGRTVRAFLCLSYELKWRPSRANLLRWTWRKITSFFSLVLMTYDKYNLSIKSNWPTHTRASHYSDIIKLVLDSGTSNLRSCAHQIYYRIYPLLDTVSDFEVFDFI